MEEVQCVSSFRLNFKEVNPKFAQLTIKSVAENGDRDAVGNPEKDLGRDVFAWKKHWLIRHWKDIPDFLLGELEFDLVMATMIRESCGIYTDSLNRYDVASRCELDKGFVLHKTHKRQWISPEHESSPAKFHNRKLAYRWYLKHGFSTLLGF